MKQSRTKLKQQQSGMMAIMVTIVLMSVISLIVLGFSQTIRHEQRQTLDTQLSTQAFYAAESGINLARKHLTEYLTSGQKKQTCGTDAHISDPNDLIVSDTNNVRITCLLIDPTPYDLHHDFSPLDPQVGLLETTTAMSDIVINWQARSGPGSTDPPQIGTCNPASNPTDTVWSSACKQPLLRIDLVRLDNGTPGGTNATTWRDNQYTAFLYPSSVAGSINAVAFNDSSTSNFTPNTASPYSPANPGPSPGARGKKYPITCNTSTDTEKKRACKVKISLNGTSLNGTKFGYRLMSVYGDASVSIGAKDSAGNPLLLQDGQVVLDSTAIAQDVSHRIQARVSLKSGTNNNQNNDGLFDFGIYSNLGLCKQYTLTHTTYNPPGKPGYPETWSVGPPPANCKIDANNDGTPDSGW